ncbi:MAG: ABC transporter permease [Actinomycetales bacterium]|nr:ABC transporter permease [Actinomycetales bacterium]
MTALVAPAQLDVTGRRSFVTRMIFGPREAVLIGLIVVLMIIMWFIEPRFLALANLRAILIGSAMEMVLVVGVVFLMVGKMFDLSLDGVINMVGVVAGLLMVGGVPWPIACAAALAAGAGIGLINGICTTTLNMNPLMTTLATWWIARGIAFGLTQGISPYGFPQQFVDIGYSRLAGIPIVYYYALAALVIGALVLAFTKYGYDTFAVGGNRLASRLRGIPTRRVTMTAFLVLALLAGFTGLVYAARLNAATPQAAVNVNLRVIAAAVIGGCALAGGRGTVIGGVLGVLFVSLLLSSTLVLGIDGVWQYTILGGVILVAVGADALAAKVRGQEDLE